MSDTAKMAVIKALEELPEIESGNPFLKWANLRNVVKEFASIGYLKNEVVDSLFAAIWLSVGTLSVLDQLNNI